MILYGTSHLGMASADRDHHRQEDEPVIGQQTVEVPRLAGRRHRRLDTVVAGILDPPADVFEAVRLGESNTLPFAIENVRGDAPKALVGFQFHGLL